MAGRNSTARAAETTTTSLVDAAYRTMRAKILDNEWAPGHRALEQELALELGVSRTPLAPLSSSFTPNDRSSAPTSFCTAGTLISRRCAARAKLPSSAEAMKYSSALSLSMVCGSAGLALTGR